MPRISTKHLKIKEGDLNESVEIVIFYTTALGFYAQIPDKLNEQFDQLDDKEMKALSAAKKYERKYASSTEPHKRIVTADSEEDVVKAMRVLVTRLLSMKVQKSAVIIVTFENKSSDEVPDGTNLPQVGLELEVTYCFEVSTGGDKPKYYTYHEREWFGEMKTERHEVSINGWRDKNVIIPDTPDNRQFVEDLHAALKLLVDKLVKFTQTRQTMLNMIAQRQKLLS